jgi:plastocyanin
MLFLRPSAVVGVSSLVALAGIADVASGQSVLERPPHLSGGWLGTRGTLQFNFVHRFGVGDAPLRKVTNSPTFLLSYNFAAPITIGFNYATSSDVASSFPNEWEPFARVVPLSQGRSPIGIALQIGYNQAAESVDGEVTASFAAGPAKLFAVGRYLSNGYNRDTTRYAVGGGATLRLTRHVALAGDITTLLDLRNSEEVAWGAALQLAIPHSPHTLSLQVTNTNTATLQGQSRGIDQVRGGFEFTIPFTLSRYSGGEGRRKTAEDGGGEGAIGRGTAAEIRSMAFTPSRIEVTSGTTVTWTNNDMVAHTVTADNGAWDSGSIEPGKTWSHTFSQTGDYSFHCTPHPFMRGVVVVR